MNKYDSYPVPAIAELLEELCPQGVRSHRLDKIFKFTGGYTPSKRTPPTGTAVIFLGIGSRTSTPMAVSSQILCST